MSVGVKSEDVLGRKVDSCLANSAVKLAAGTGCSLNFVFFSEDFKIFQTLAFLCSPSMSVCVHTPGRLKTSACSRTDRVQFILRKKHNI